LLMLVGALDSNTTGTIRGTITYKILGTGLDPITIAKITP